MKLLYVEPTSSSGHDFIFGLGKYKTKFWIANSILYTEHENKILEMVLEIAIGELNWRKKNGKSK